MLITEFKWRTLIATPVLVLICSVAQAYQPTKAVALGELSPDDCQVRWTRTSAADERLDLQRIVTCVNKATGAERRLVELKYDGQTLYTIPTELQLGVELMAELERTPPEQFTATIIRYREQAEAKANLERTKALSQLRNRLGPSPIAILKLRPYDVSEHTDGTGIEVEIANLSKKAIKYVTFHYVGLNAVGDPVRDLRGQASRSLRGIGPIETGERAAYDRNYAWMTDIVESVRVSRIEIEFMDRSKTTVNRIDRIRIGEEEATILGL